MATYSVNSDLAEAFQKKFPRRCSAMIEDFIRSMLGGSTDSEANIQQLQYDLDKLEKDEATIYAKRQARLAQIKELEVQKEKAEGAESEKIAQIEEDFVLAKQDSGWYHNFCYRYIKSGSKDSGLSELDFFKREEKNEKNN